MPTIHHPASLNPQCMNLKFFTLLSQNWILVTLLTMYYSEAYGDLFTNFRLKYLRSQAEVKIDKAGNNILSTILIGFF